MNKKSRMIRLICGMLAAFLMITTLVHPQETVQAAGSPYYIKVNRQQNVITVYGLDKKGKYTVPVKAMLCSTGVNNATPAGTFTLSSKYRWHALMGNVYGQYCSRIVGGVLFHSVFYNGVPDPSKLAYNSFNRLGVQASHGCVRVSVKDAKWIYDNCPSGTKVTIYDSSDPGPLGKPAPIRIDVSSPYRGWDPTDPNPNNPWRKVAPKFTGLKNRTVERGTKKLNLKKGVTATDYKGTVLKVTVKGKCNTKKSGKYKITYRAKSSNGLETVKVITITVKDTKPPKLKAAKKKLTISGETSLKKIEKQIRENFTITDCGEKLSSSKYLKISDKKLTKAVQKKKSGTYEVVVYAVDKAGNKSKKVTIKVKYTAPQQEDPTDQDQNNQDQNNQDSKNQDQTNQDQTNQDQTNQDQTNQDQTNQNPAQNTDQTQNTQSVTQTIS